MIKLNIWNNIIIPGLSSNVKRRWTLGLNEMKYIKFIAINSLQMCKIYIYTSWKIDVSCFSESFADFFVVWSIAAAFSRASVFDWPCTKLISLATSAF